MKFKHKNKHLYKNILLFFVGAGLLMSGVVAIYLSNLKIPDFDSFDDRKVANSTKIYDRTGEVLLYDIHQDIKRTSIPLESISPNVINATLAIEDSEFYNHNGVRITSTVRAVLSNIFGFGIGGGGSTITQQVVKNSLLTQKKSITRKIKEWFLAFKMDASLPKEKILEHYLNGNPYGGSIYGVEEASKTYFDKSAIDLTLTESAYLAAIPQSPTRLSPYGSHTDQLETRKNLVLSRMRDLGYITQEEFDVAITEQVEFKPKESTGIKAPHFVFFVREYLEEKYGAETVEWGGLKITTTLNYELQEKAEEIVLEGALENEERSNGSNSSLVAIDPKTGQILTLVGSRNYFDKEIDGNYNVATALRQPGSSFKPFIYATAFNKGFTPDTVLFDVPTEFQTTCDAYGNAKPGYNQDNCYMPRNYDDKTVGPISLRNALAQSRNIPAVKLFYLAGLNDSLRTAEAMGITTLTDVSRYGLTLVIGGGEVSLLDITSAYAVFANEGKRNPYTAILKVEDSSGRVLEEYSQREFEVLPRNTALTISDVLSDNQARIPTFGASSMLNIANTAVKTGTTNSNRDAWTIGYSPNVVVGVWAGNNDNTPMKRGGVSVAGPIWNKFMREALKVVPNEKFEKPNLELNERTTKPIIRGYWQGGESFFIDTISGKLATEFTPMETIKEKVITNVHTILHWIDRDDITGNPPINPVDDSQYINWEIAVQDWWANNSHKYSWTTANEIPSGYDDVHGPDLGPMVQIIEPTESSNFNLESHINVKVLGSGLYPIQKVDVFVNNIFVGTTKNPLSFSFSVRDIENLSNTNELRVIVYDSIYNKTEKTITFMVN